ncbi:hypothetical protein BDB01DRAFT_768967 [Pilobolus umbonatus]|nr:hypothetical protein BDB01DRAFT_768967 [Pilobolus umbonatus]
MSFLKTRQDFEQSLLHFYNKTNACPSEPPWTMHRQSILNHAYLSQSRIVKLPAPLDREDVDVVEEDDECVADTEILVEMDYHIVYSPSYQVPVLYFRATYYHDKTGLSLDDLYQYIIPSVYQTDILQPNSTSVISQSDHPALGVPYWYVHPCETRTLMHCFRFNPEDYIQVWLSIQGPILNCQLSTEMFLFCMTTE